ncbi:hypothetical protein MPSEU_000438800 [Mayamaea pseudoterrestris]|nr:hypothetical protein MPSEU_000438800 [Mayamaea pseudoterrestris]
MSDAEGNNANSDSDDDDDIVGDLDAFLTSIESKLRSPFSSLELTKAIVTPALRVVVSATTSSSSNQPYSARQYLRRIRKILVKTNKSTQLRILIALLGLDSAGENDNARSISNEDEIEEMDAEVSKILQEAQTTKTYDEWVRVIAGLVQYKIASRDSDASPDLPQETANMGTEAKKVLDKTCKKILQRVNARIKQTEQYEFDSDDEEDANNPQRFMAATADADPTLAPFYYALLSPSVLQQVLPEVTAPHQHFKVNESAEILHMDAKMEELKAMEEQTHDTVTAAGMASVKANASMASPQANNGSARPSSEAAMAASADSTAPAGAAASRTTTKQPVKKKSSMFLMPTKPLARPGMSSATSRGPTAGNVRTQPILKARKAGAAQALLRNKKSGLQRNQTASSGNSGSAAASLSASMVAAASASRSQLAAERNSHQRSKMKMMDVTEVQDQFRKQQAADLSAAGTQMKKKRKADAAALAVEQDKAKVVKTANGAEAPAAGSTNNETTLQAGSSAAAAAAAAALSAYQQTKTGSVSATTEDTGHTASHTHDESVTRQAESQHDAIHAHHRQQDWRQLLQERSNRLSIDDRLIIEQFFQRTFSHEQRPTGSVKLKLHEERLSDPDRKETYYLELDYDNLTSKQSKKIKRY